MELILNKEDKIFSTEITEITETTERPKITKKASKSGSGNYLTRIARHAKVGLDIQKTATTTGAWLSGQD